MPERTIARIADPRHQIGLIQQCGRRDASVLQDEQERGSRSRFISPETAPPELRP